MQTREFLKQLLKESIRSGSVASIVMMPPGFLFRYFGLRVGHYGKKLGEVLFGGIEEPAFQVLLVVQHFVIGWLSAAPLLLIFSYVGMHRSSTLLAGGALYGVAYYAAVNSLALPLSFGEALPWQLGFSYMYPSMVVHVVFGLSIGYTCRNFVRTIARVR